MTEPRKVLIRLDDRARLISAALAATLYPLQSQQRQKHGVTLHARGTRKWVSVYGTHPAVLTLQGLLDAGIGLEPIYTHILDSDWPTFNSERRADWVPPEWGEQLRQFHESANLAAWWTDEDEQWQLPIRHLTRVLAPMDLYRALEVYFGPLREQLVVLPNISFPTDQILAVRSGDDLFAVLPPRRAWGDSAPWPYESDKTYVYQEALRAYLRLLLDAMLDAQPEEVAAASERPLPVGERFARLHPIWREQFTELFIAGAMVLFLEDTLDPREARAYAQQVTKVEGLTLLPNVVRLMKRYEGDRALGKYATFMDYFTIFIRQLRVTLTLSPAGR